MDKEFYKKLKKEYSRYESKDDLKNICFLALFESYERVKEIKGISIQFENDIRDKFVIDLEQRNKIIKTALKYDHIILIPESHDPSKRARADLRFKITHFCELIFECKKLSSAEQRYLNDGLNRFIELKYAEKESDGGMIGFVVKGNFIKTISKLKEKVKYFHIIKLIDRQVLNYKYSFQSLHKRNNSTQILISHLFFRFS